MENSELMPFIRAIEAESRLSSNKKHILCLLLTSITVSSGGLTIVDIGQLVELSKAGLYKIIRALEKDGLIERTIKDSLGYISINLEAIEKMRVAQEAKKGLISKTLRLRYPK